MLYMLETALNAADKRIEGLEAANADLVREWDRSKAARRFDSATITFLDRKLRSTRGKLTASVALNVALVVALAVVIVRCL